MDDNSCFIKSLTLKNFLSYGEEMTVPLRNLNIIIGPNGSGKSNFIDAISLLQTAPQGDALADTIRDGGGASEWLWRGGEIPVRASIGATVQATEHLVKHRKVERLDYGLEFAAVNQRFEITDECLEDRENGNEYIYYRYQNGRPVLNVFDPTSEKPRHLELDKGKINPEQSIFSQRLDEDQYPELYWVGDNFRQIRIFREWSFGRRTLLRKPQPTDDRNDFLKPDCSNLGLVLNSFKKNPSVKKKIREMLAEFYGGAKDFDVSVEGGTAQLFIEEEDFSIPATRLSDGTLRYLCLLAILCHPKPPPVICIEEPELGMHPDIMPVIAGLMKTAAERTQLIVTTHSETLIEKFSDMPESVLVCEKNENCSTLRRLDKGILSTWLDEYSLGQLWRDGEIGGNRW